jgi:hypothetical protein
VIDGFITLRIEGTWTIVPEGVTVETTRGPTSILERQPNEELVLTRGLGFLELLRTQHL